MVGFALEHQNLPQEAVDFASQFYEELRPKNGVKRISNKIRDLLKNSIAIESYRMENGRKSCLQNVTKESLTKSDQLGIPQIGTSFFQNYLSYKLIH